MVSPTAPHAAGLLVDNRESQLAIGDNDSGMYRGVQLALSNAFLDAKVQGEGRWETEMSGALAA